MSTDAPPARHRFEGLGPISALWGGQLVSLVGTGMTRFAASVWIWERTESATAVSIYWALLFTPSIFLGPIAGTFVDRWNRKLTLVGADLGAGAATVALLALAAAGSLEVWHLYAAGLVASACEAFQHPAQLASMTTMVPRSQLGRANGIASTAQFGSGILGPAIAGATFGALGLAGILWIDVATFTAATLVLLFLRVPEPERTSGADEDRGSVLREMRHGFRFIGRRPSLTKLLLLFFGINVVAACFLGLIHPMVLARTGDDSSVLGLVMAMTGVGGVCGSVAVSVWGCPRSKVDGILVGMATMGLLGVTVIGLGRGAWVWSLGAFVSAATVPVINSSMRALWQEAVPPDLQGRIFGVLTVVAGSSFPLGMMVAGPLADGVFEPLLAVGGPLADGLAARLFGTGPGAGMSLMMALVGIAGALVGLSGYLMRDVRRAEELLRDADDAPVSEPS